jgi:hypothetical protein
LFIRHEGSWLFSSSLLTIYFEQRRLLKLYGEFIASNAVSNLRQESALKTGSISRPADEKPWSAIVPNLWSLPTMWRSIVPLILGLLLFVANNLAPLAALSHPRPGYVPLFMPRNQDSAQYLTWIEGYKNAWTIPDYHAPWETEAALRVPLMWIPAKVSSLTQTPTIYAYLGLQAACYVLAFYGLAFLLRVFAVGSGEAVLAVALMICAVPLRSFALLPALLLKPKAWALLHCGYEEFLGGFASEGFFQGVAGGASINFGTTGALFSLALFGRYFCSGKRNDLWAASLVAALSGFLHPFEFIPITTAATFALLWLKRDQSVLTDLIILGVPASAVVLFYFLPTLTHPWLRVATDLNRFHRILFSHRQFLSLGLPVLLGVGFAFWRPRVGSPADRFLACYVVTSAFALHMPFLPWPQHFKDGLDYAAAIFVVRKLDQMPRLTRLWASRTKWRIGLVLLLVAGGLAPHLYFRYLSYRLGTTATEAGQNTAVAPTDEVRAIAWLRSHAASRELILAPLENAPWMATVPMHSFASHWIFSLTDDQQAPLAQSFFQGTLSDAESDSLLQSYGVRYVLVPLGNPALRYVGKAQLRWTGQNLQLYEFPQNEMRSFPKLQKVSPGHYIWNPK